MVKENSIITLDDGDKYFVSKVFNSNNIIYAYIFNINNKDDDGFVSIEDNKLKLVTNENLIKNLFKMFCKQ